MTDKNDLLFEDISVGLWTQKKRLLSIYKLHQYTNSFFFAYAHTADKKKNR